MNKKKIYLVITPFFPEPDSFRGPYVLDQVKALMRVSEYQVVVMKPCAPWHRAMDYEIDGVTVHRFRQYTIPSNLLPNRVNDWLSAQSMFRKLRSMGIHARDLAVCHAHVTASGAYALAVKKRNPQCVAIVQHHGFDVMSITDGRFAKFKWHEQLCIRYGTRICNSVDINVGVSQKTLDYVKSYPGVHLKKEYVLYNGVDTTKFYPPKEKIQNERFTIGCIGNFWPLKDQMTLIKAVERLVSSGQKDILVRFIGTGATRQDCEQYVANRGLDDYFSFENEVMHDKLLTFYQSLDLFVLPSYWEAFGCVYTEAYACGVPFIGVKGQGISEIIPVEEQDWWLIEKGDDKSLAEIILDYKKNSCKQHLSRPWEIGELMKKHVKQIESCIP
ncbi:MAG: glycosyltransferase family 4 protein [Bacteroidales bacterium]|nr:glycosyltransferase family 4 protein [Bacteroidales bacterium]